jgi:RNA polymerase sigma factor (sigma-70 family)
VKDPSADEDVLWAAALVQDGPAFGRLFDLHRDAVLRQALRLVSSPADAEEVAASAFFELWRKRESVRLVNGSLLPWLLVTAANLSRNSSRSLMRRERLLRRAPRDHDDAEARAFARIDDDLPRSELVLALRRLPQRDAALVTMAALEGYRVAEIAQLLGLTENAARVRLHRAHKKLRGLLAPPDGSRAETQEVAR